jgi:hypothetical protein
MESRTVSRRVGRLHLTAATLVVAVLSAACSPASNPRDAPAEVAGRTLPPGSSVAVITGATVVAFWLKGADTIARAARRQVQNEFRRSNQALARYLSDTDVGIVATVGDTLLVRLSSGVERVVMLSGLDYPYGYVFIEPGFAEEFHTGLDSDNDLESAVDDYFGLEDDAPAPRRQIASCWPEAQRLPGRPGPRMIRPGMAPVCAPSRATRVPFTNTYAMPTESW